MVLFGLFLTIVLQTGCLRQVLGNRLTQVHVKIFAELVKNVSTDLLIDTTKSILVLMHNIFRKPSTKLERYD